MDQFTERRRHSAAHILALAAQRLFPDVKLGIGPVTKDGFYHDFEFPRVLEWEDIKSLELIEMVEVIKENKVAGYQELLIDKYVCEILKIINT